MWKVLLAVILLLGVLLVWVALYDSNRFVTVSYSFQDPRIRKDCRAVVIADLHNKSYGPDNALLLEKIEECNPDMILIAGDLLTAVPGKRFTVATALLRKLSSRYPVYYANGNHEQRLDLYPEKYGTMGADYEKALGEMGVRRLVNERVYLPEYGIEIVGAQLDRTYYDRQKEKELTEDELHRLLGKKEAERYTILLAHKPDYFGQYAKWGADLTVAGHIHGGVARVPFWGKGIISTSFRLFPKYDGGLYREEGAAMVLSRGLGAHTIPIRLFNPAELPVIDLKGTNKA